MDILRWIVILAGSGFLLGLAVLAVYAAVFRDVVPETPWTGRLLYYFGQALLVAGIGFTSLLILASAIVAVLSVAGPR